MTTRPEHYDVIVIGSGAGGGTLTHALAPTGKRVLLLERGDENLSYVGGRLGLPFGPPERHRALRHGPGELGA